MKTISLIGYPLGHSFSKKYFTEKFLSESLVDFEFKNYEISTIEMVREMVMQEATLVGFNVTIPYKQQIMDFLDEIDISAKNIGAVNCVKVIHSEDYNGKIKKGVKLIGYNTDVYGFKVSLLNMIGDYRGKAVILGAGGASKAVQSVLKELGIEFIVVSRTLNNADKSYETLTKEDITEHKIIINTTPLGTYPNITTYPPVNYGAIGREHFIYDLVYNPSDTIFTKKSRIQGATVISGYMMLKEQAECGWNIFVK